MAETPQSFFEFPRQSEKRTPFGWTTPIDSHTLMMELGPQFKGGESAYRWLLYKLDMPDLQLPEFETNQMSMIHIHKAIDSNQDLDPASKEGKLYELAYWVGPGSPGRQNSGQALEQITESPLSIRAAQRANINRMAALTQFIAQNGLDRELIANLRLTESNFPQDNSEYKVTEIAAYLSRRFGENEAFNTLVNNLPAETATLSEERLKAIKDLSSKLDKRIGGDIYVTEKRKAELKTLYNGQLELKVPSSANNDDDKDIRRLTIEMIEQTYNRSELANLLFQLQPGMDMDDLEHPSSDLFDNYRKQKQLPKLFTRLAEDRPKRFKWNNPIETLTN